VFLKRQRLGILIILASHAIIFNSHAIHYISLELMRPPGNPNSHDQSWWFNPVFKCSWDTLQMLLRYSSNAPEILLRYSWEQTKQSSNVLYNHNSHDQSWHILDSLEIITIMGIHEMVILPDNPKSLGNPNNHGAFLTIIIITVLSNHEQSCIFLQDHESHRMFITVLDIFPTIITVMRYSCKSSNAPYQSLSILIIPFLINPYQS
jgi:hypothetical protein